MNITDTELLFLLGYSVVLGVALAVCYGLFAFVRILASPARPHGAVGRAVCDLIAFVTDVGYALFAGVCVVLLFFGVNGGRVRLIGLLGCGAGFSVWHFSAGRWLIDRLTRYVSGVRRVLRAVYRHTLGVPISFILRALKRKKERKEIIRKKRRTKDEKLEFLG